MSPTHRDAPERSPSLTSPRLIVTTPRLKNLLSSPPHRDKTHPQSDCIPGTSECCDCSPRWISFLGACHLPDGAICAFSITEPLELLVNSVNSNFSCGKCRLLEGQINQKVQILHKKGVSTLLRENSAALNLEVNQGTFQLVLLILLPQSCWF